MKVSISWLKEYIPLTMEMSALSDALTMAGLEVEGVSDRYGYLNTVVVGRIAKIMRHPKADKLKICQVDLGDGMINVVCGAPNASEGMFSPCALPGTELPGGSIIEKGVIRGEESYGMLCSEKDLGLGADKSGLMELCHFNNKTSWDLVIGSPIKKALGLSDPVIEIDLTPNRPDCLSLIGVAREIAVFQNTKVKYPEIDLPTKDTNSDSGLIKRIEDYTSVKIQDPDLCPRYAAKLLFDITVAPSPLWLQDRLMSVGLKPINNIVDITNFVMMEMGQPLHAFDFDLLYENRIVVRRAKDGEAFTTLDGKERKLSSETLMICDGEKPVALAGVMGGLNSEIHDSTTSVLIESAYFNPVSVRKTAKKLGLNTDASHRFERGADPDGTVKAINRAAQLMAKIGGGELIEGTIDNNPKPYRKKTIPLDIGYTNRILGTDLDIDEIKSHLESIEFEPEKNGSDTLDVVVPSFRVDAARQEDLIEEVARLSGYNNIKTTFPLIPAKARKSIAALGHRNRIKDFMVGLGFIETINYSFINRSSGDRLRLKSDDIKRNVVEILNPISEDQTVMRTSLMPGLLETMHRNISIQEKNLKIFEVGKIFIGKGQKNQPKEVEMVAGLWTGLQNHASWHLKEKECDFYDIKGVVEALLDGLCLQNANFTAISKESCGYLRPGYVARISLEDKDVGLVGEIDNQVLGNFDLKQPVFIFELNLDLLTPLIPQAMSAQPLPKFPSVSRDITMIIGRDIETLDVLKTAEDLNEKLVENIHLFDIYNGDPIPEGKKSISFRIVYRSSEKTLEYGDVKSLHTSISEKLIKKFDAMLPA